MKIKQASLEARSLFNVNYNFKPKVVKSKKVYSRKGRNGKRHAE